MGARDTVSRWLRRADGCPRVSGGAVARFGSVWLGSAPAFVSQRCGPGAAAAPTLTHRGQLRAGSGQAEPPLGLQAAGAVLVGHAGDKAQPAGGRAGAPLRAPLLARPWQRRGRCPGGCRKRHEGGEGDWRRALSRCPGVLQARPCAAEKRQGFPADVS